ncbi:hypothetical protein HK405_005782 [Cladochytrium tenue]|nr:hypothetical protein HK405_005782 [Cladochytrium tenue]
MSTATIDLGIYSLCVGISSIVALGTGARLAYKIKEGGEGISLSTLTTSSGLGFLTIAFFANLLYVAKTAVILLYFNTLWLPPAPRYFAAYFLLNSATVLLYFLYERRISLLFANRNVTASRFYAFSLWFFMLAYVAITIAVTVLRMQYAVNNSTGGYGSSPAAGNNLNVLNYAVDMAIGILILSGTTHTLIDMVQSGGHLGGQSLRIYRTILGSDCLKYAVVAAIEAYKLATAANTSVATPPSSFQHLIDTIKIAILTINLFAPVAIAKVATSSKGTSGSHHMSSQNATKKAEV